MAKQLNVGQRWTTENGLSKKGQSNTFTGLGDTIENSLATEKGHFWQTRKRDKKGLNRRKRGARSIRKSTFGGLGEAQNISLATEKGHFRHIREDRNTYANHQKLEDKYRVKNPFRSLGKSYDILLTTERTCCRQLKKGFWHGRDLPKVEIHHGNGVTILAV